MKTCTKCHKQYPGNLENFYRDETKSDGLHSWCKGCQKARSRTWAVQNPDKYRAYMRKAYRKHDLKRAYGITVEQYEAMLIAQGGVCAICGTKPKHRRLPVDHDHATKAVRGLLCPMCNHAIERLETDSDWAAKAKAYLERFRVQPGAAQERVILGEGHPLLQ